MAQTHDGAILARARKLGLTVPEFEDRCLTEKWCTSCKEWHIRASFGADRSRFDGLSAKCRRSAKEQRARRYVPVSPQDRKRHGPRGGVHTAETRARMSAARKGKPSPLRGRRLSVEQRAKISAATRERTPRGSGCHSYKDGLLAERRGERFSLEYKRWRFDVFARDGFHCRRCGDDRGGNLHVHHVRSFADHPDLRLDLTNGLTLCDGCHRAYHRGEWAIEEVVDNG